MSRAQHLALTSLMFTPQERISFGEPSADRGVMVQKVSLAPYINRGVETFTVGVPMDKWNSGNELAGAERAKWLAENGQPHSINDEPAVSNRKSDAYFQMGVMHRDGDAPAFIGRDAQGRVTTQVWMRNGEMERENGAPQSVELLPRNFKREIRVSPDHTSVLLTDPNGKILSQDGAKLYTVGITKDAVDPSDYAKCDLKETSRHLFLGNHPLEALSRFAGSRAEAESVVAEVVVDEDAFLLETTPGDDRYGCAESSFTYNPTSNGDPQFDEDVTYNERIAAIEVVPFDHAHFTYPGVKQAERRVLEAREEDMAFAAAHLTQKPVYASSLPAPGIATEISPLPGLPTPRPVRL